MTGPVIEVVTLRVKPGISDAEFADAAEAANAFLKTCPGFIRRRLAKDAEGGWIDYVEWHSMDEALAAAKAFNHQAVTRAFNDAIAPGSVTMRHLYVMAAAG